MRVATMHYGGLSTAKLLIRWRGFGPTLTGEFAVTVSDSQQFLQAPPTSRRRPSARLRLYSHPVAAPLRVRLIQALDSMKAIPLLALSCLLLGCTGQGEEAPVDPKNLRPVEWVTDLCADVKGSAQQVSIADLTTDPGRYDGKVVSVSGYYYSYFEHSAIYSTQEADPYSYKFSDGLWIQGISPFAGISGEHLEFVGTFSSKDHGHLGQWPGTICVTSVTEPA